MDGDWKAARLPLAMALPGLLIQVGAIAALLLLTYDNLTHSLFATILGVVWLQVTRSSSADQVGEWRTRRELFGKLGEWLGRENARREFDDALAQAELIDSEHGIEDPMYRGSALSEVIVGFTRGAAMILLNIYLVALILWAVWKTAGI